ncbi:uncharacterized protein LOC109725773 isoform X2 [Ananas comosus]|uniref:Uncharacterized protein LOC109725773 isoform X2 n=1 Tax=Ananas comosus TaxID=4615 RepID=A0A6P5GS15_ANACO|nr:uncharacterized protein LOC109725773 isoform X2 [Ananas comosus]
MATVGFRLAVPPPVGRGGEAAKCVSPSASTASRFPRSPSLALPRRFPPRTRTHRRPSAPAPGSSISEKRPSSAAEAEAEAEEEEVDPCAEVRYLDPEADGGSIREWELDFCSRPILDERGKKVWELVVCDRTLSLQYTRYFPNNVINSVTLKDAIASVATTLGVPLPDKIRFFRSQMVTIITKACNELGIKPIPSKRCISLLLWLEERYEVVYSRHPGFQPRLKPLLSLDNPFPMNLPENLFGDRWAFVQLPFSAWMNGLEVSSVETDIDRGCLILSVGVSTRYIYATYKKSARTTQEAEAWEAAKKACGGLHFLAIQECLDSEDCVGFWLLLDLPPPPV